MSDVDKTILSKLRMIAASATSLADEYENRKLRPGDLTRWLSTIHEAVEIAQERAAREDKP